MRPVLTLAVAAAFGKEVAEAIPQAIGIELFHNFTLLHDDVMDRADTRHGRPTVHLKWNESTAILSGDAMLTMASQYIASVKRNEHLAPLLELFNTTAMEVYQGQQYDMDFESRRDVTIDEYISMIILKTSVLIGCACRLGAIVADASAEDQRSVYDYGLKLGVAFQLQDDYLDTYGDPAVFGKKIGGDILNEKKTWLLISAMQSERAADVNAVLGQSLPDEEKIAAVRSIYDELSLPAKCRALIDRYINEAITAINATTISDNAKRLFIDLAGKLASRDH